MLDAAIIRRYSLDEQPKSLFTVANPKTAKGEAAGYFTIVLHLAPAQLSGREVCRFRSAGCTAACLNTAGQGGIGLDANRMNPVQVARIRRTRYFSRNRSAFMLDLVDEISQYQQRAIRKGLTLTVRLNGTSDIPWENVKVGAFANVFAMFPDVQFYDYTKFPVKLRRKAAAIPNYHLTFSLSETNLAHAEQALIAGVNVAVPMFVKRGADLPARHRIGRVNTAVIDGDKTDLRFLDAPGLVIGKIVGLRVKGTDGKRDESGFVQTPDYSL